MQVELTDAEAKVVRSAIARCMAEEALRPTLGNRLMAKFDQYPEGWTTAGLQR